MSRIDRDPSRDISDLTDDAERAERAERAEQARLAREAEAPNPAHTTTGKVTSPKFGSAGSGGLEYEGNFDRD